MHLAGIYDLNGHVHTEAPHPDGGMPRVSGQMPRVIDGNEDDSRENSKDDALKSRRPASVQNEGFWW